MTKIMPPIYFYSGIILIILLHYFSPVKQIIIYSYNLFGILLIGVGIILNLWSNFLFKKFKTTIKPNKIPSQLIFNSTFKVSRNPIYLGMLLILLGISTLTGNLISFIIPIIFFIMMNYFFIPVEEKNMRQKFGNKYLEYKNKVRRWL